MSILRKELTFEGGVNLRADPHLLKSNEWQSLRNLWPYSNKLLGTRPSLLHEQDVLPVPGEHWNGHLFANTDPANPAPTAIRFYGHWFRHLTPLRAIFLGDMSKMALVCVCNYSDKVLINEQFEGEAATQVTLTEGDVILMLTPNDLRPGPDATIGYIYPIITAVRLGRIDNITPSLIDFNGDIIAANKGCDYVVRVVKSSSLALPSATVWPGVDYRFTKVDFGPTNLDFRADGVVVYKNRFMYWKDNKVWASDPFQPGLIYEYAVETAYLGVFFDTALTEDITAMSDLYMSDAEDAGSSVLAIWTQHSMILMQGEPAETIASTPEEVFANCRITRLTVKAGCISQASIVKTKHGLLWCGAESVWFMPKGNLPVEVGYKIAPRIRAQSFESAGRIFATYDDNCYRLVINKPGVGYNPYEALNEMWCLSFIGDEPSKESASWFGPQVFLNTDNPQVGEAPAIDGSPGLFCCAKLVNINDDKTWYVQPYSMIMEPTAAVSDGWGTRLGLASISEYLGADITAPSRAINAVDIDHYYYRGDVFHLARGIEDEVYPYGTEYMVIVEGTLASSVMESIGIYINELGNPLLCKRPFSIPYENSMPDPYGIAKSSGYLTFDNPELMKLISGYELTFKTLSPVLLNSFWWPWEPNNNAANVVTLESKSNIPIKSQNILNALFNEPVLTARRIPPPNGKRYNGLTAQLNTEEPSYKVIVTNQITAPEWTKIRMSSDNITWKHGNLFLNTYGNDGVSKYALLADLLALLQSVSGTLFGSELKFNQTQYGLGVKKKNDTALYIDLSAQGWEWFGFVPTNLDIGYGVNIISNVLTPTKYMHATGPSPVCTPRPIHLAKLAVRYSIFGTRPR